MRMMRLCFGVIEEELAYVFGVTTGTVPLTEIQDLLSSDCAQSFPEHFSFQRIEGVHARIQCQ